MTLKPFYNFRRFWARRQFADVSKSVMRELWIHRRQIFEQVPGRFFTHCQILVVRSNFFPACGNSHAGAQTHANQIEQNFQLGFSQGECFVITFDSLSRCKNRIFFIKHCISASNGNFCHGVSVYYVTKIDSSNHLLVQPPINQYVIIIGVVINNAGAKVGQYRNHLLLKLLKEPLNELSLL